MPRDFRHRAQRDAPRTVSGPVWFVAGLIPGLAVAGWCLMGKPWLPPVGPAPVPPVVEAEPAPTGKTPRFDFFTVLPEREFVVPDSEPATPAPPTPNAAPAANASGRYTLQVGSFRRADQADQLKAQVALLGLRATIQRFAHEGDTWHRVRLGPYPDARSAREVRDTLKRNGLNAVVLRERGD
ncbi:MAG: SPOR domain-containing protein [Chromatiales bacterium]|nr:SPOR domain-containing protein [Chromatiales bacterium]